MPLYEYLCKPCAQKFETLRGMRDDSPAECPLCGGADTMRQLSVFAAQSRGSESGACETSAAAGTPCCRTVPGSFG